MDVIENISGDKNWSIRDKVPSPIKQLKEYYKKYPVVGQSEVDEDYQTGKRPIVLRKYGSSDLKLKDNNPNEIQVINCTRCTSSSILIHVH